MPTVSSLPQATASPRIKFTPFTYCTSQLAKATSKPRYFKGEPSPLYHEGAFCFIPRTPRHTQEEACSSFTPMALARDGGSRVHGAAVLTGASLALLRSPAGQGRAGGAAAHCHCLPPRWGRGTVTAAPPPQGQMGRKRRRQARWDLLRISSPSSCFYPRIHLRFSPAWRDVVSAVCTE